MNMISRYADQPLHQGSVFWRSVGISGINTRLIDGLEEDHNIAAPRLAIPDERHPRSGRHERDPVDEQVIAYEQRVLHRTRRNDEVLSYEGQNKQAHHQN